MPILILTIFIFELQANVCEEKFTIKVWHYFKVT